MKIEIRAIGKLKNGAPEDLLIKEYQKRLTLVKEHLVRRNI